MVVADDVCEPRVLTGREGIVGDDVPVVVDDDVPLLARGSAEDVAVVSRVYVRLEPSRKKNAEVVDEGHVWGTGEGESRVPNAGRAEVLLLRREPMGSLPDARLRSVVLEVDASPGRVEKLCAARVALGPEAPIDDENLDRVPRHVGHRAKLAVEALGEPVEPRTLAKRQVGDA